MISVEESVLLMDKFIQLRSKYSETGNSKDLLEFKKHEKLCIEKFKYIVAMHTDKYRGFFNYDDLIQEGYEALIKSMKNFQPTLGSFFWWAHRYIETRVSRSANLHTAIRYPLKYAKLNPPHKETTLPIMIESRFCPDKNLESMETQKAIQAAMKHLNKKQQNIISLAFGFDGGKPLSVNKICKKLDITRLNCIKTINMALNVLKQNIRI